MDLKILQKKIVSFFKEFPEKIKELPSRFKVLPRDEKIAYIVLSIGILLFLIALFV